MSDNGRDGIGIEDCGGVEVTTSMQTSASASPRTDDQLLEPMTKKDEKKEKNKRWKKKEKQEMNKKKEEEEGGMQGSFPRATWTESPGGSSIQPSINHIMNQLKEHECAKQQEFSEWLDKLSLSPSVMNLTFRTSFRR